MLDQNIDDRRLLELLERLCLDLEGLREDLRPELRRTETFRRRDQEQQELREAAAVAVKKHRARSTRR